MKKLALLLITLVLAIPSRAVLNLDYNPATLININQTLQTTPLTNDSTILDMVKFYNDYIVQYVEKSDVIHMDLSTPIIKFSDFDSPTDTAQSVALMMGRFIGNEMQYMLEKRKYNSSDASQLYAATQTLDYYKRNHDFLGKNQYLDSLLTLDDKERQKTLRLLCKLPKPEKKPKEKPEFISREEILSECIYILDRPMPDEEKDEEAAKIWWDKLLKINKWPPHTKELRFSRIPDGAINIFSLSDSNEAGVVLAAIWLCNEIRYCVEHDLKTTNTESYVEAAMQTMDYYIRNKALLPDNPMLDVLIPLSAAEKRKYFTNLYRGN